MKIAVCELPDGLDLSGAPWLQLIENLQDEKPDLLILNEMPVGDWIAVKRGFDRGTALRFAASHDALLSELARFSWGTFGSRPVAGSGRLANEAFLLANGSYHPAHHKHYFPQEEGWYERDWFAPVRPGFEVVDHGELRIGALLCTELFFNEWARHYRRLGANIIAAPRAAVGLNTRWSTAGAMAAIVSGCYVVSSNRSEHAQRPQGLFGGEGFVYDPNGELVAKTSASSPIALVDIDLGMVKTAQQGYPCYVSELQDNVD